MRLTTSDRPALSQLGAKDAALKLYHTACKIRLCLTIGKSPFWLLSGRKQSALDTIYQEKSTVVVEYPHLERITSSYVFLTHRRTDRATRMDTSPVITDRTYQKISKWQLG